MYEHLIKFAVRRYSTWTYNETITPRAPAMTTLSQIRTWGIRPIEEMI